MINKHFIKKCLIGTITFVTAMSLIEPLTNHRASASIGKWITITTNKDRLYLFGKPSGSYAYDNKGMHVEMIGSKRYHHRLYYEVIPGDYGAEFPGYILASSTNATPHYYHGHYKAHQAHYKYGYWRHGHYHHYKTGYYLNSRWHYNVTYLARKSLKKHSYRHYSKNVVNKLRHTISKRKHNRVNYSSMINAARNANFKTINNDRNSVGLGSVSRSSVLDKMAQLRSKQLVSDFSHKNANGVNYITIDLRNAGYSPHTWNGENIAYGAGYRLSGRSAGKFANTEWWTDEKGATPSLDGGHRKNIRNPNFKSVGVGATYVPSNDAWYMAQDFSDQTANQIDRNDQNNSDSNQNNDSYTVANNNHNNDDSYTVNDNNNNDLGSNYSYSNKSLNNNNNNFNSHGYSYSNGNTNTNINNNYNG